MDLFKPVVAVDRLHHNFLATIKPNAAGVRDVVAGWAEGFVDRDGKFLTEFQTTYNSSFWELYLFAVLKHLGIKVGFSHLAPDFVATDHSLAIEAAIASHAQDDVPEWEKTFEGITDMDIEAAQLQSTIRLSNTLMGKSEAYKKRYADLAHMAGRAYVVAIANYGRQDFNFLGDVSMQRLLYDPEDKKQVFKANGAPVPLGLFNSDSYAHISAVIFSCVATFGKTRALGRHGGEQFRSARPLSRKVGEERTFSDARERLALRLPTLRRSVADLTPFTGIGWTYWNIILMTSTMGLNLNSSGAARDPKFAWLLHSCQ